MRGCPTYNFSQCSCKQSCELEMFDVKNIHYGRYRTNNNSGAVDIIQTNNPKNKKVWGWLSLIWAYLIGAYFEFSE